MGKLGRKGGKGGKGGRGGKRARGGREADGRVRLCREEAVSATAHSPVPTISDRIVRAARQHRRNLPPSAARAAHALHHHLIFIEGPLLAIAVGALSLPPPLLPPRIELGRITRRLPGRDIIPSDSRRRAPSPSPSPILAPPPPCTAAPRLACIARR